MGDKNRGLYKKFHVERNDGGSRPGKKHYACEYFVLDLNHDTHALPAIRAYAVSCATDYPQLALEVLQRALEYARQRGETPGPEPLCEVCGQDWDAETADQQCTYAECPYLVDKQVAPPTAENITWKREVLATLTAAQVSIEKAVLCEDGLDAAEGELVLERLRGAYALVYNTLPVVVETRIVMQEVYEGYLDYIVECLNEVRDGVLNRVHPVMQFSEWKVARAEEGS